MLKQAHCLYSTCRVGCPALIKVKTTEDGERLVVKEMVKIHNREVSELSGQHNGSIPDGNTMMHFIVLLL